MAGAKNYLVLSFLFVSSCCSPFIGGRSLDLRGVPISVAGRCCPTAGSAQPCDPISCPLPVDAGNITDGNAFTEWRVEFPSSLPGGAQPEASFTLKFGQVGLAN